MSRVLSAPLLLVILAGCASGGRFGRVADELVIYPTPPDTARVQFLFAVTSEADVRGSSGGFLSSFFDEDPQRDQITKPYGVDYYDARFYVCDSMLPGVDILDVRTQEFRKWVPSGEGALRKPINCTIDPDDGSLYVADTERRQVVVFDSTHSYVGAFGESSGTPVDVAVDGDRLWVANLTGRQVQVYDKASHQLLFSFPDVDGEVETPLRQPTNLTVRNGLVYVSDFGDFNIKVYDGTGNLIRVLGSHGRNPGQFTRPKGVAVDREGRTYVVDASFQNVQIFDAEGELLMFFGGGYQGPGGMWLPAMVRIVDDGLDLFREYVDPRFDLEYVILVTNQYGPDRLNVYGFVSPAADSR